MRVKVLPLLFIVFMVAGCTNNKLPYANSTAKQALANEHLELLAFTTATAQRQQIVQNIGFEYTYSLAESIPLLYLDMTITNNFSRIIADIYITCTTYNEFHSVLENKSYLYQEYMVIGESVTLERVSFGFVDERTHTASCKITDAASMPAN